MRAPLQWTIFFVEFSGKVEETEELFDAGEDI